MKQLEKNDLFTASYNDKRKIVYIVNLATDQVNKYSLDSVVSISYYNKGVMISLRKGKYYEFDFLTNDGNTITNFIEQYNFLDYIVLTNGIYFNWKVGAKNMEVVKFFGGGETYDTTTIKDLVDFEMNCQNYNL